MNVYEMLTNKILEQLDNNIIPWQKSWVGRKNTVINYVTRKEYKGINQLLLPMAGEYLTFKQCASLGGKVKKGEKASMIVFFKWIEKKNEKDEVTNSYPVLNWYNVFHISQCEGIESKMESMEVNDNDPIEVAENIVSNYISRSNVKLNLSEFNEASYSPSTDTVTVPKIGLFTSSEEHYSTMFHELGHSTGHESRLNRLKNKTTSKLSGDYSFEELVAEITAVNLINKSGIDSEKVFNNSVAYIQGWSKFIRSNTKAMIQASSLAEKATDCILV
jgi:Antirestriction protein